MNRIYRVLWNASKGCYIATNEACGISQSRGKAVAAVLATALAIGATAHAADVHDGVLTAEAGLSSVVLHNNVLVDDKFAGLETTQVQLSTVSQMVQDAMISGIADGITNVYFGQGRKLTISGENLEIKADLIGYSDSDGMASGNPHLQIGSKDGVKTTGTFGTISMGLPNLDSTLGLQYGYGGGPTLVIENADISIDQLRLAHPGLIDADAKVGITTLETAAIDKTIVLTNRGELNVETAVSAKDQYGIFKNSATFISNYGNLAIDDIQDAHLVVRNEAGGVAEFGSFVLHQGEIVTSDGDSINRGTMNVSDSFVLSGATHWGSNAPMFAVFRNNGILNVGTEQLNASEITINGQMYNSGAEAKAMLYGNVTVADTNVDDEYKTMFSNTDGGVVEISGDLNLESGSFINQNATLILGGTLTSKINIDNQGTIKASAEGEKLTLNAVTFTNSASGEAAGSLEGFAVELTGEGTLNLAAGSADLSALTLTAGTAYIGQSAKSEDVSLGAVSVGAGQKLHVAGGATVTTLHVNADASIDQAVFDGIGEGMGSIDAQTVTNNGSIVLNELASIEFSDSATAIADIGKLTLQSGEISGSVKVGEMVVTAGEGKNLLVGGSATEVEGGNLRVTNSARVEKGASITISAENGETATMKVVGQSGTSEIDGILSIAGTVSVNTNGGLYAEGLTLDGGTLDVTASSAQTDSLSATQDGGTVNLSNGGKLTVAGGSTAGITFNFNGAGAEIDFADSGIWFENSTLNLNGRDWNLKGKGGDGFGFNTVNVNDGSTVTYTADAVLKNNTALTINTGAVVVADKIVFEDRYTGGLTLAGGTLTTTLDQIFTSVNADEFIEGTNVTDGSTVQIPVSGIQSVGAVKDELLGEHGIVYESGTFKFTDDGWTINAVNSASSMLQNAFDTFVGSESTLVFSGTQDAESGVFDVEDANKLNSNIVLSGTILSTGRQNVTFGDDVKTSLDALVTVPVIGFQAIADAGNAAVSDGHHLYLTGFEGDNGQKSLFTDTEDGVIQITEDGKLTLGLDGHETGGAVSIVLANNGHVEVAQNGTFSVDVLKTNGDSTFLVGENGTLNVALFGDSAGTQSTINGTLNITQEMNSVGTFVNNGSVAVASSASFADLANKGSLTATGSFNGTKVVNDGSISSDADANFASLSNSGKVSGTTVSVSNEQAGGTLHNLKDGSIEATNGGVVLELAGENDNAGAISGTEIGINLDADAVFTNSGTIVATEQTSGLNLTGMDSAKFVNSGSFETASLHVESISFETTSKVSVAAMEFTAASVVVSNDGALQAENIDAVDASIVNNGSITTSQNLKLTGGSLENNGALSAEKMEIAENAAVSNNGTLTVKDLAIDSDSTIQQTDSGIVNVENLTVTGNVFALESGTWQIGSENGIKFVDEQGEVQSGIVNVFGGKEFVTANVDVENTVYNVTQMLSFGSKAGIAEKLGIENVNGILTIDKGVELGAGSAINVGSMTVAASERLSPAFTAANNSVTIFTGNAFGADGSEAGLYADPEDHLSAVIDQGAQAVLTDIQQSGQYKLLEGFDLSANLDSETGEWIGGWTGENGKYVTVDNGSDLEWKVTVSYDKETNTVVADTVAADVRSVYNFATPDIANAALSASADAAKGADVTFMQSVINNKDLSVAQTERIVNSVTQIAASLGTAANFLNDTSKLMDSVEARTVLLSDAGREHGLWVRIEGGKYSMDSLSLAGGMDAGYDTNTYGVTFGADGLVRDNLRIGAAFSYLNGSADSEGDALSGTNDYDTYGLQAYGAYDVSDTMRISGELGWFHSSSQLAQNISFADVRKAEADIDTDALTFGVRSEWKFESNGFAIVPHVGLRGIYMMNDDFSTEIDGKKAFGNDQDNTFTVQIPIGVSVEKVFATVSGWNVVPTADVTIAPQFGDTEYDTTVTGVGTGVSQSVTADMAGNFTGRVAFGVRADNGASSFGAYYGFAAGDAGRQDHSFNLSFGYRF